MLFGKEYTGKQFNEIMKDTKFYKFTNATEKHNGFQYATGLNIDTEPFNTTLPCIGGIFFTDLRHAHLWVKQNVYFRIVTIRDYARVAFEKNKYKTDRIILGERQLIHDEEENEISKHLKEMSIDEAKLIKKDPTHLKNIKQTEELCLMALRLNPHVFQYVKEQTPVICSLAIKLYAPNIIYVKEQSEELCWNVLKTNAYYIRDIKKPTEEMSI